MAKNETNNKTLEHALKYASLGLAVFPCQEKGKRPAFKNWQNTATTDPEAIKTIWTRNPQFNLGIATGSKSNGLIVVDIDNHDVNGADSLAEWEQENGKLPETATVLTGSGGVHYYYRTTEELHGATGVIPGVDIRAEGNLIIAPPSIHPNGNAYEWDLGADLDDPGIADADETVMKLINGNVSKNKSKDGFVLPDVIRNSNRNTTLHRYACSLQAKGRDDFEIRTLVKAANEQKCDEPLDDKELDTLINSALKYTKGGHGLIMRQGKVRQCADNVLHVLENDELLKNQIQFNTFSKTAEWFAPLPWDTDAPSGEWTDREDSELKAYLDTKYDLTKDSAYLDGFNMCLNRHYYHPVQGWLKEVEKKYYDGQEHIRYLLPRYLGAEDTPYNAAALHLFMQGAIKRVFEPGCKFDYVLVLVGEQGKGKSMFLQYLAGNSDWYDGNFATIEGDKAIEKLRGRWILEMAELLAVKKQKDVEAFKAFVTTEEDGYRAPYERRTKHVKRQCVFAATTNDFQFMSDRTGNRRYLPIRINVKPVPREQRLESDPEATKEEFKKAWAEAYHIFTTEHPQLVMPQELELETLAQQSMYMQEDPWIGLIQEYLDNHQVRVCSKLLWDEALGNEGIQGKSPDWKHITAIMEMNITGWHQLDKRARCGKYGIQICYEPDQDEFVEVPEKEQVPF